MSTVRIGVLTSGGDAQGMNATVRAVVRTALARGAQPYAILEGWQGACDGGDSIKKMEWSDVSSILAEGGTVIGTARCAEFRTYEGRHRAAANLLEHGIDHLVVIGGDGSLSGTNEFRGEWAQHVAELAAEGVTLRGIYDVSAMRDNADIMIWTHGATPEKLQAAVRKIRRTALFAGTTIVWSTMGVHREAEFTRNHAPAYARGKAPEAWVCVYPFVRSYDWYYMNPERRAEMLKNHGMKAIDFPQVLANTVAAFGMNDYEWVLALEAPELVDLVDMMRHFRNTEARLHVREETPFYTGRRIGADEVAEVLA